MPDTANPDHSDGPDPEAGDSRRREAVAQYVDLVEAQWRRNRLGAATRRRLGVELEESLLAALQAGAGLHEVLDVDATTLARDIAAAEGLALSTDAVPPRPAASLRGTIAWGVGGMVAAAALFWFFLLMPLAGVFYRDGTTTSFVVSLVMLYGTGAALTLGAAVLAMRHHLRHEAGARRTALLATALAAVGGVVGVVICLGIAARSDYSDAPGVVLTYVVVTGGLCSAGIALAWRRTRPAPAPGDLVGTETGAQ